MGTQFKPWCLWWIYFNHWVDATTNWGFFQEYITSPVVSISVLTWTIIDMVIMINLGLTTKNDISKWISTPRINYCSCLWQNQLNVLVFNTLHCILYISHFIWLFKLSWLERHQCLLKTSGVQNVNTSIYDQFIYKHWVDATATGFHHEGITSSVVINALQLGILFSLFNFFLSEHHLCVIWRRNAQKS